ncbi:MAG: PepSY domain-containing protein [Piscirickettsiaceae bacterium]|nr:PepSY domain-containing protein [Piscirickettsiaceae bacterium]
MSDDIKLPLSKESAAKLIRSESNGKVLSIETTKINNKTVFQAKVLHDNGTMKMYLIDPKTGQSPR